MLGIDSFCLTTFIIFELLEESRHLPSFYRNPNFKLNLNFKSPELFEKAATSLLEV